MNEPQKESGVKSTNLADYLAEHGSLTYRFVGTSMLPLLRQDRDLITVTRKERSDAGSSVETTLFSVGDVVLYRRPKDGAYVLHRIVGTRADGYVILGDNCVQREYGIRDEDILGVMTSFVRDGKTISVTNPLYKAYVKVWCALEPLRKPAKLALTGARHVSKVLKGQETPAEFVGKVARSSKKQQDSEKQRKALMATGDYLIALLNATLHDTTPPDKPADVSWRAVYTLSKRHTVDTMAFEAVCKLMETQTGSRPGGDLLSEWQHRKDANVAKNLVQLGEREKLLHTFTENGLDVLPLKGSVLIDEYPNSAYRQMADLDLLIRADQAEQARSLMEELGYKTAYFGAGKDDTYELPPFLHVELHRELIPEGSPAPHLREYYEDPWKRALPDENAPHRYHFSPEDYYVFQVAHFFRHFQVGGSGIRNVMDIAAFLDKYGNVLDETYLNEQFEALELNGFRKDMEFRAKTWFSKDGAQIAHERGAKTDFLLYSSGAYGLVAYSMDSTLNRYAEQYDSRALAALHYVRKLLFPNYEYMTLSYPALQGKHLEPLLPLLWVFRILHRGYNGRRKIPEVFRALRRFRRHEGRTT